MAGLFAAGGEARELEVAVVVPSCPSSSPPPSAVARSAAGRWVQDIEIYGQNGHTYWSVFLTETNIYYLLSDLCHVFSVNKQESSKYEAPMLDVHYLEATSTPTRMRTIQTRNERAAAIHGRVRVEN